MLIKLQRFTEICYSGLQIDEDLRAFYAIVREER